MTEILNDIRNYIKKEFIVSENIEDDQSLTESGIIDSMGIINIIEYLESKYNIEIDDEDILQKNFGSINKITNYTLKKINNE